MWLRNIRKKLNDFVRWAGSLGYAPGDSAEVKSHKSIMTIGIIVCIFNLVYFSFQYKVIGRNSAALTLIILAIFLTLHLAWFRIHRNFPRFRNIFFSVFYFYLVIYHCVMGGYIGSVEYIYYAIPILTGIQMFYKKNREKNTWYLIYIVTAIILYFLEPIISKDMVPLPDNLILLTFVNNFILIASLVFLSINYYANIIEAEKLKSDNLIRNILPQFVVSELNTYGKSSPIMAANATIIFMDFVNFSTITKDMSPHDLVTILNEHFTNFDQIFHDHKIEKLKTIGDGYMAAGGVPEPNHSHPIDAALAAMQILLYMDDNNAGKETPWYLRIGIHSGPMIAGIIGKSKFSYDVWGSNVNLGSRLESYGKPCCINVSHEFMELTHEFFEFESRGFVEIKHGELIRMYFLTDIKESLRSAHFQPNQKFYALYDEYARTPFHFLDSSSV